MSDKIALSRLRTEVDKLKEELAAASQRIDELTSEVRLLRQESISKKSLGVLDNGNCRIVNC